MESVSESQKGAIRTHMQCTSAEGLSCGTKKINTVDRTRREMFNGLIKPDKEWVTKIRETYCGSQYQAKKQTDI